MLYWYVAYVLFMEGFDVMNPMESKKLNVVNLAKIPI